jgi:hypothetical protein
MRLYGVKGNFGIVKIGFELVFHVDRGAISACCHLNGTNGIQTRQYLRTPV